MTDTTKPTGDTWRDQCCNKCDGWGYYVDHERTSANEYQSSGSTSCDRCGGTGRLAERPNRAVARRDSVSEQDIMALAQYLQGPRFRHIRVDTSADYREKDVYLMATRAVEFGWRPAITTPTDPAMESNDAE